jgi:type I restriction enzyme S subunit
MSRYKAYPEYRDSGVEWLERVPAHWSILQLKRTVDSCVNGIWGEEPKNDGLDTVVIRVADFDRQRLSINEDGFTYRRIEDKEKQNRRLKRGDLLLEKSGGGEKTLVGQVVLFDKEFDAVTSNFVAKMTPLSAFDSRYLNYVFARFYFENLNLPSVKQNTGIQNLDSAAYLSEKICIPALIEQQKIADFLDHETAKIDTLIAKQQELIKLLKEKRQAVISHAVTKGLNPNAPMRDSGVEWLGEVPAHWLVKRIGNLFAESNSRASSIEELEYPILSVSIHHGISDKELNEEELDRKVSRSEDKSLYKVIRRNDLAYNMMRAWQGGFGASTLSGLVSPAYVVCNPLTSINSYYFELVLRTPNAIVELKRYSRGITDFRLRLYWDEFKCIEVPVPPPTEANDILDAISKIDKTYDNLIAQAGDQISLLQERRTALISAAVTGKIDVRDWQAPTAEAFAA